MNKQVYLPAADRRRLYLLWSGLVLLNAAVSLWIALQEYRHPLDTMAMIAGIATFVVVYAEAARFVLINGYPDWHRTLIISVSIKAATQFVPAVEIVTGALSVQLVEAVYGRVLFLSVYLTTLVDGMLLSVVVLLLTLPVRFAGRIWRRQSRYRKWVSTGPYSVPPDNG